MSAVFFQTLFKYHYSLIDKMSKLVKVIIVDPVDNGDGTVTTTVS